MAVITPDIVERIKPGRPYPETVKALAEKWGKIFNVDPSWPLAHCRVESSDGPLAHNKSGNAFGLMQIKPGTAENIVNWIKKSGLAKSEPHVKETLKAGWHGQPEDLFNPDVNVMLGTFYLGYIKHKMEEKFGRGDHEVVAAAYNQGPGAVHKALRSGTFKPTEPMKEYMAKIAAAETEDA